MITASKLAIAIAVAGPLAAATVGQSSAHAGADQCGRS